MKRQIYLIIGIMFLLSLNLISAYDSHKLNNDYTLIVSSKNASSCNLTYIQIANNVTTTNLEMTKTIQDFYILIDKTNFSSLNDVCLGVTCFDGVNYEQGNKCLSISTTGSDKINNIPLFLGLGALIIFVIAFIFKNEYIGLIAGILFIVTGMYFLIYGLSIFQNLYTQALGYTALGLGLIISFASVYELFEGDNTTT